MKRKKLFLVLLVFVFTGSLFSQRNDVIVLDAKNGSIDDVVKDLVLDRNILHLKNISIQNVSYNFGTNSDAISFYGANPWFDDSETYAFRVTETMRTHNFKFWFHPSPSDREGRRYVVVLGFLVESFEILDKKYAGVLPPTVLDPTHPEHWGKRIF